jgi:hypothetical protein
MQNANCKMQIAESAIENLHFAICNLQSSCAHNPIACGFSYERGASCDW